MVLTLCAESTALLWIDRIGTLFSAVLCAQQRCQAVQLLLCRPLQALCNLPASQPAPQQSAWWAEAWLGDLQARLHPSRADLAHFGSQPDGLSPAAAAVACMHPVVELVMADLGRTPGMEAVLACTEGASFGHIAVHMELGIPVSQNEVGRNDSAVVSCIAGSEGQEERSCVNRQGGLELRCC